MFANRNSYLTPSVVSSYYPSESIVVGTPEPCVTVKDLKVPLNKYDFNQDVYIGGIIEGVQQQVERFIGHDATLRVRKSFWRYPKPIIGFAYQPVGDITEVKIINADGSSTVLDSSDYVVYGFDKKTISFNREYYAVEITHGSGYAVTPEAIKQAVAQECMFQFKNRNDPSLPARVSINNLCIEARHLLMGYYDYAR